MATSNKSENSNNKKLPRHIALIRLSAMGDVAMLAHTVRAFQEVYPDVRLTIVTRRLFAPFFNGLNVDFLFADTKGRHKGVKGIWRLWRDISKLKVDAVADMHSVMRSVVVRNLCWMSGKKTSAKDKGKIEKWFRVGYNSHNSVPLKHTVVRYCDVLRKMGFEFEDPTPAVKLNLPNPMGEKSGVWVGFAPFSAHDGKTYPEDLRVEVVRKMSERYSRVYIHSGGGAEAEFARNMESQYENVTALNGKGDLGGELNLMSHLDCIVSMDSLAMHMASLTATPVVSVWGATHPSLGFLGWGCPTEGILQEEMPCRPCSVYGNKPCESKDYKCLRCITPDMIVSKIDELITPKE